MLGWIIFFLGSVGFIILSRNALRQQHIYALPRLFAFESLLGLVVLNAGAWFEQPSSLPQLLSWLLLIVSATLAIYSFRLLHTLGAPVDIQPESGKQAFEKTTHLVTTGPYRYIRHPLYASLLYLGIGIYLKQVNLVSSILVLACTLALILTAKYEEQENLAKFGSEYADYMQHTKRFIPFIF